MYLFIGKNIYFPIDDGLVIRIITVNKTFSNREKVIQSRAMGTKVFSSLVVAKQYAAKLRERRLNQLQENISKLQEEVEVFSKSNIVFKQGQLL